MEFNQIRYFLALAETLNFTRAAERCCVSQPALTRSIKLLEEELGGQLLIRNGKNTRLSEMGRDLHASFLAIEAARQSLKDVASEIVTGDRGELHIGIAETISPSFFSAFVSAFREDHPTINLHLVRVDPKGIGDLLLSGEIDVCFTADLVAQHAKIGYTTLSVEPLVAAFPEGHAFAGKDTLSLEDLFAQPLVARRHCAFHNRLEATANKLGTKLNIAITTDNDSWVRDMVRCGTGIALLPESTARELGLNHVGIDDLDAERRVELATVYGVAKSVGLRAFLKAADQYDWDPLAGLDLLGRFGSDIIASNDLMANAA